MRGRHDAPWGIVVHNLKRGIIPLTTDESDRDGLLSLMSLSEWPASDDVGAGLLPASFRRY
jgi:hypothetical protein